MSETTEATAIIHGAIGHVELTAPDLNRASEFYSALFGWEFHPYQETEIYFQTPGKGGPCGCLLQGDPGPPTTKLYVNVDDIQTTLEKAIGLGAVKTLDKTEIPGGHGFYARFVGPDGNEISLYSRD